MRLQKKLQPPLFHSSVRIRVFSQAPQYSSICHIQRYERLPMRCEHVHTNLRLYVGQYVKYQIGEKKVLKIPRLVRMNTVLLSCLHLNSANESDGFYFLHCNQLSNIACHSSNKLFFMPKAECLLFQFILNSKQAHLIMSSVVRIVRHKSYWIPPGLSIDTKTYIIRSPYAKFSYKVNNKVNETCYPRGYNFEK